MMPLKSLSDRCLRCWFIAAAKILITKRQQANVYQPEGRNLTFITNAYSIQRIELPAIDITIQRSRFETSASISPLQRQAQYAVASFAHQKATARSYRKSICSILGSMLTP